MCRIPSWFLPLYYTGNSIAAAAERQILHKKRGKKSYRNRIKVWPARVVMILPLLTLKGGNYLQGHRYWNRIGIAWETYL